MKKIPDIESGFGTPLSKVDLNENNNGRSEGQPSTSSITNKPAAAAKNYRWAIHTLAVLLSCICAAGAGYALFVAQRAPQMATFQTQLDR